MRFYYSSTVVVQVQIVLFGLHTNLTLLGEDSSPDYYLVSHYLFASDPLNIFIEICFAL